MADLLIRERQAGPVISFSERRARLALSPAPNPGPDPEPEPEPAPEPELVTAPAASPLSVAVGESITFTLGTYENADSVVGVLLQDGTDRTAEINDGVWNPGVVADWSWSVTASGDGGDLTPPPVLGTVTPAEITPDPEPEPAPLSPSSFFAYGEPADAPQAVGGNVETFTARGAGAPAFSLIGSTGLFPTKEADAIRFNVNRYLAADGLTIPAGDGFMLVADFTPHQITGTQQVLSLVSGSTQLATLRGASAVAQVNIGAGLNGTAANIGAAALEVGRRVQMVLELDRVAGTLRFRNVTTGQLVSQPMAFGGVIAATRIQLGQSANVSLHRWAVVGRPEGGAWPVTLERVLADFNLGDAQEPPAVPETGTFAAMRFYPADGQSLEQGTNSGGLVAPNGSRWRDVLASPRVRMLTGHRRKDGVQITHVGSPFLQGYDVSVSATGDAQAYAASSVPPGYITALDLAEDLPAGAGIAYAFHSAAGQTVTNLDPFPEEGTSLIPWENATFWMAQASAFYRSRGAAVTCPGYGFNQGEADVGRPRGWWLSRFLALVAARFAQIRDSTGQASDPVLYLNQTGGYMLKEGINAHLVVLDQLDAIRQIPGSVLAVVNHALPVDNADGRGVHFGVLGNAMAGHTRAWAIQETEAGRGWNLLPPETVARVGDAITIPVSIRPDESLATVPGKYAAYGGDPANLGLEVVGGGSIVGASVSGGNIVLQVRGAVTAVRYAMQETGIDYRQFLDASGAGFVTHRGLIQTTLTKTVQSFGGLSLTLPRPMPSFEVSVT